MRIPIAFLLGSFLIAHAADMTDFDGDGLPDVWEAAFGLRTNSAAGVDGPYGDPDCDGLNNLAEYRAGYYNIGGNIYSNAANAVAGLCPTNGHSVNTAVWDAYLRPAGTNACLRWLYTDHDFVDDSWETTNAVATIDSFDNDTDIGGGISAWTANRMASMHVSPSVTATFYYRGIHESLTTPITLHFYSDPRMNGQPDAIATVANPGNWSFPLVVSITNFSYGYIHPGTNYVWAFMDAGDLTKPCAVSTPFANLFGFSDNKIAFNLTSLDLFSDNVYPRIIIPNSGKQRVRVLRSSADSYPYQDVILDKVIQSRAYLHEGDFMGQGNLGLDWGLVDVPTTQDRERFVYQVYVGDNLLLTNNVLAATFTNIYDMVRAQAVATSPTVGKYVYSARPTFKWTMPDDYIAFEVQLKQGGTNGDTIWDSGTVQEPVRDPITGEWTWKSPICVGDTFTNSCIFSNNCTYAWRVIALNSKFTATTAPITWSAWNTFYLNVPSPVRPGFYGKIGCSVSYAGASANRHIAVEAFANPSFSGYPEARYTFDAAESVTNMTVSAASSVLIGLSPGTYYVRAYLDSNTNGVRDVGEPWGYQNRFGETSVCPYDPKPCLLTPTGGSTASVIIED